MNKFQFLGYSSLQICKYTFELALSGLICWMKLKSPCHCWHRQLYFIEDYVFMCFGFHKKQTGIILSEVWYSMSQQVQTSTAARPLLCWEAWGTHTHLPSLNHSGLTIDTLNYWKWILTWKTRVIRVRTRKSQQDLGLEETAWLSCP